jgi:phosphonate transport system ATP-binding protein
VRPGEIVAVVGRSGAGKSTLLRCMNGIQRPTSGAIRLNGMEITSLRGEALRRVQQRIGFIWQEYNLVLRLSVMKNVLCGRLGSASLIPSLFHIYSRQDREIAVRSLERVNMLHRATQRADMLSGGEKQRVGIARALAQSPVMLLADEPVASLDPELSWQVMSDLTHVARDEGVPTVINIHQIDLAKAFCDRIVGIARGVVVFDGTPAALTQSAMDTIYRHDPRPALEAAGVAA